MVGKLVIFDGSDLSGKKTQTQKAVVYLRGLGHSVQTLDFPRYEDNMLGQLLRECLDGKKGDFSKMDPHIASVLYAADRYESRQTIENWLMNGDTVILDRYVTSNQIHQGGKIADLEEREEFLLWLSQLEYKVFKLPHPDLVLYLEVSATASREMLRESGREADIVEKDESYIKQSIESAQRLSGRESQWRRIICEEDGKMLDIETIHSKIITVLQEGDIV